MGIRAQGNPRATYNAVWQQTAKGASGPGDGPFPYGASGGTIITDGLVTYHVFLGNAGPSHESSPISPQTFTTSQAIPGCKVLLVGGGGGAANDGGGGGGGGGIMYTSSVTIPGPQTILVGERGTGAGISDGSDSTFGPGITATGGGKGEDGESGHAGGSGGGGGGPGDPTGGEGTQAPAPYLSVTWTGYGNDGAPGGPPSDGGAGGGGAGSAGSPRPGDAGGAGGNGQPFPEFPAPVIAPALPTTTMNTSPKYGGDPYPSGTNPNPVALRDAWIAAVGPTGLFGGGGGGGAYYPVTGPNYAEGGDGGGGAGASSGGPGPGPGLAYPGLDYCGGGGGAATSSGAASPGRPAGRGICIIKYTDIG